MGRTKTKKFQREFALGNLNIKRGLTGIFDPFFYHAPKEWCQILSLKKIKYSFYGRYLAKTTCPTIFSQFSFFLCPLELIAPQCVSAFDRDGVCKIDVKRRFWDGITYMCLSASHPLPPPSNRFRRSLLVCFHSATAVVHFRK